MNKELADKWVSALRSGNYKQGSGVLRNASDEYCCLGVACEVAGITPVYTQCRVVHSYKSDTGITPVSRPNTMIYAYEGDTSFLNNITSEKVGMKSENGSLRLTPEEDQYLKTKCLSLRIQNVDNMSLSILNDLGVSFEDIADIIENHWEEL